jgi:S-formylglutathione hydrolase
MQLLQKNRCFEGEQRIYQLESQAFKGSTKLVFIYHLLL